MSDLNLSSRASLRRGFTLTELLVSLSIIALLSAMALPALRSALARADQTVCLSNLRQIGQAVGEYVTDHGYYPAAELPVLSSSGVVVERIRWYHALAPYLAAGPQAWSSSQKRSKDGIAPQGLTLPSADDLDARVFPAVFSCPSCQWPAGRNMSYGINHQYIGDARKIGTAPRPRSYPISPRQIEDAARTVLVADSAGTGIQPYRPASNPKSSALGNHSFTLDSPTPPMRGGIVLGSDSSLAGLGTPTLLSRPAARHRGGVCVLFADMSARWVPLAELVITDALFNGTGRASNGVSR